MDPFAAIGLAGNITAFLEFGYNVLSKAKDIRKSATGASSSNQALASMTQRLQDVTSSLLVSGTTAAARSNSESLAQLAAECHEASQDLLNLLEKLRALDSTSKWSTLKAALRETSRKKKDEVHELEKRLDRCRQQLSLELVSLSRSESYERLSKLMQYGESGQDELASLLSNVQSLRSGIAVSFLSPEALEQIQSLLNLSNEAATKVRESRILEALRFDLMDDRFHDVKEAHEKTFDWIFRDTGKSSSDDSQNSNEDMGPSNDDRKVPQCMAQARSCFNNWMEHGDGMFHISGKPGAGKSTLMKYLCQSPKTQKLLQLWAGDRVLVFSKFFFWRPGTELQKSLSGLIRGLLYCLLSNSPDLIPIALPGPWERSSAHERIHLEQDQIRKAFDIMVSSQESRLGHKFVFFIDGLDEFMGNHAVLVRQLFEWTDRTKDVKICVSSREWAIFQERFSGCPNIKLQELTRSDIERVVRDELNGAAFTTLLQEAGCDTKELEASITGKSDGVFLWVSLMLRLVEDGLINGDLMPDLQRKIDSLPTELETMFQHLFDSISRPDLQIAYLILDMALLVSKTEGGHCCLSRYSFLEDYLTNRNFAIAMPAKPLDRPLIVKRLARARRRVYGICKGFLEVVPFSADSMLPTFADRLGRTKGKLEAEREVGDLFGGAVKLTHRSVVEFLRSKPIRQRIDRELQEIDTFDACCQTLLAQVKAISMHQQGLCFPDAASSVTRKYDDFRTVMDLNRYTLSSRCSRRSAILPAWLSDNLIDVAQFAMTNIDSDTGRFEEFIINVAGAVAAFALPTRYIDLIDSKMADFWCTRTLKLDLSAVPSLVMVAAGPPLSRTTLNPAIKLWMLLSRMEQVTRFGSQREASATLHNLRLYLATYGTPNEDSLTHGVPSWHFYLWKSCWSRPTLAIIALFLYYGANPWFWIVACPQSAGSILTPSKAGAIYFWFMSGAGCNQNPAFDQVASPERIQSVKTSKEWKRGAGHISAEYAEFWKRHNYKISFRELVELWFPRHASQLQPVIDWLAEQDGELLAKKRRTLQDMVGACLRPLFEVDTIEEWRCVRDLSSNTDAGVDSFGSMVPGEILYSGG